MQKQRLLKLAKGLKRLSKKAQQHFDMCLICSLDDNDYEKSFKRLPIDGKNLGCETAACALGWTPTFFPRSKFKINTKNHNGIVIYTNKEGNFYDFRAAEQFYDLSRTQSIFLFDPMEYEEKDQELTAKVVAKRIEKFVKNKGEIHLDY